MNKTLNQPFPEEEKDLLGGSTDEINREFFPLENLGVSHYKEPNVMDPHNQLDAILFTPEDLAWKMPVVVGTPFSEQPKTIQEARASDIARGEDFLKKNSPEFHNGGHAAAEAAASPKTLEETKKSVLEKLTSAPKNEFADMVTEIQHYVNRGDEIEEVAREAARKIDDILPS